MPSRRTPRGLRGNNRRVSPDWCKEYSRNFGGPSLSTASATKTSVPAPPPSKSIQGKGGARATDEDMEIDGEGEPTGHLDLLNNPMAEDEGDLDDDNYTGPDSELSDGGESEGGGGSDDGADGSGEG